MGLKPEAGIEIKICKINQKKILHTFGAITSRLLYVPIHKGSHNHGKKCFLTGSPLDLWNENKWVNESYGYNIVVSNCQK